MLPFHRIIFCVLLLLPVPQLAQAYKTVDIFTTQALVINQSAGIRRQAAVNGLATVLVRLSGSNEVLDNELIKQAIGQANRYLLEFRYQSTDQTLTILGNEQPATELVMRFSQAPLENLLKEAQLSIWSANRPDVLLWAVTNKGGKAFVGRDSVIGKAFDTAARERGLPFISPILDLEDRRSLPVARMWAMDEDSVRQASSRYQGDATLAGRFRPSSQGWSGDFMLLHRGELQYFRASEDRPIELARAIVGQVADYFASLYAVSVTAATEAEGVLLQVNNVSDFGRYAQVVQYLEALTLVDTVALEQINGQVLQVRVILKSNVARFLSTIELDNKLILDEGFEVLDEDPAPIEFTWFQ